MCAMMSIYYQHVGRVWKMVLDTWFFTKCDFDQHKCHFTTLILS